MNTGSHPAVAADIPRRTYRSTARSSAHLAFARYPDTRRIFECPMPSTVSIVGLNILVWACVATWWLTTAPTLANLPA